MASIQKRTNQSGEVQYYVIYRKYGKQAWKNAGSNKELAKQIKIEIEKQLISEEFGIIVNKKIGFTNYVDKHYLPVRNTTEIRPATYTSIVLACKNLKRFFENMPMQFITTDLIRKYIAKRTQTVGNRSVNIELVYLKQIFDYAIEAGYVTKNICRGINKLPESHKIRYLTTQELDLLLLNSTERTKAIILVTVNLGLRHGEVSHLRWSDISFESATVTVRAEHAKSKKDRIIPLNDTAKQTLLMLKENANGEFVFHDNGNQIKSFKKAFNTAVKKSELKNITPHSLRHTYGTHHALNGTDIYSLKAYMGHADIKTTMIYVHIAQQLMDTNKNNINLGVRQVLDGRV